MIFIYRISTNLGEIDSSFTESFWKDLLIILIIFPMLLFKWNAILYKITIFFRWNYSSINIFCSFAVTPFIYLHCLGQRINQNYNLGVLQRQAVSLLFLCIWMLTPINCSTTLEIMKLPGFILIENCILLNKCFPSNLFPIIYRMYTLEIDRNIKCSIYI